MIHKIKSLYDNGKGLSIRQLSKELGISRNTVKKYLRLDEAKIVELQEDRDRIKHLDNWRIYISHLLMSYPKLSASKIYRRLREKLPDLTISERSVRRYVQVLKEEMPSKQARYYEPVIDMVPGVQCQIDGGELSNVLIGGEEKKIYFAVFVLSYSRLLYVSASDKPINTEIFIKMHDEAFRYFGRAPQECVYDQTKLVVIKEIFREVDYNQKFYRYATTANFQIRVCKGYDPESKGKVEAGVKYTKNNFFYGEEFLDLEDLKERLLNWVNGVANKRLHGTTKRIPEEFYQTEEKSHMSSYFALPVEPAKDLRKADKTGLISYKSNKYSVPMKYQMANVSVTENNGKLLIADISTSVIISEHKVCFDSGRIIKNSNHYRDYEREMAEDEKCIQAKLGDNLGRSLCAIIKRSSPKIYRDQLYGLKKILSKQLTQQQKIMLKRLVQKQKLTVSMVKEYLAACSRQPDQEARISASLLAKYAVICGGQKRANV
jgi:transposase